MILYSLIALISFASAWTIQGWRWDADVAVIHADLAIAKFEQNKQVLALERAQAQKLEKLEEDHVRTQQATARLADENARLNADLSLAFDRLRQQSDTPQHLPGTTPSAAGCADVRTARDRAIDALERLVEGGRGVAMDGQNAVDVAKTASAAARATRGPN